MLIYVASRKWRMKMREFLYRKQHKKAITAVGLPLTVLSLLPDENTDAKEFDGVETDEAVEYIDVARDLDAAKKIYADQFGFI